VNMTLRLTSEQITLITRAAQPLEPQKRSTLLSRIAAHLQVRGIFTPRDDELATAIAHSLSGLVQKQHEPAA